MTFNIDINLFIIKHIAKYTIFPVLTSTFYYLATTVANPVELINQDALLNGFCHIRLLELKFRFNCTIQSVAFSIVASTTQDGDYLVQCHWNSTLLCTPGGVWERDNGTLLLKTIFNHSAYAGHKLRAHLTCKDTNLTSYQQHYLLKPCRK